MGEYSYYFKIKDYYYKICPNFIFLKYINPWSIKGTFKNQSGKDYHPLNLSLRSGSEIDTFLNSEAK